MLSNYDHYRYKIPIAISLFLLQYCSFMIYTMVLHSKVFEISSSFDKSLSEKFANNQKVRNQLNIKSLLTTILLKFKRI